MDKELKRGNIFSSIPAVFENEIEEDILQGRGFRMERILSCGQISPQGTWYDQDEDEYVILLSGQARLDFMDEEEIQMGKGDWIFIPAHKEHRITYTSRDPKCVWLAIHGDMKTCI